MTNDFIEIDGVQYRVERTTLYKDNYLVIQFIEYLDYDFEPEYIYTCMDTTGYLDFIFGTYIVSLLQKDHDYIKKLANELNYDIPLYLH